MVNKPRPFRLTPLNPPEIDRQREIIRYLRHEPKVGVFIRINSGRAGRKGFHWSYTLYFKSDETRKGKDATDIIGMLRDGRWFCIEVKRPDELPTEGQREMIEMVKAAGGVGGIAETWRDAQRIINGEQV